MISKVNNFPSFGMAFKQEAVLDALQPMKQKTLQAYLTGAQKIDTFSSDRNVDVFLRGVHEAVERAADDAADTVNVDTVLKGFKLTIEGKGEDPVSTVFELNKMPGTKRQVGKFFNDMKGDISKIGILEEIKNKFGI